VFSDEYNHILIQIVYAMNQSMKKVLSNIMFPTAVLATYL
jgi:hypothetical protein